MKEGVLDSSRDDKLEELYRLTDREETIQNVVRELQTSMSTVLRYADLIRAESQDMSTRQYTEKLYLEAHNASALFENVIAQGSGRGAPSHGVCDAGSILRQTVSLLDYQLKRKGILSDIILPAEPLPVNADPFRLQQAFYIVLLNAVQLLIGYQGEKKIRLSGGTEGDLVRIDIAVSAPEPFLWQGEDLLKQLFETIGRGIGMGWYTLQRTLAGYGGSVAIQGGKDISFLIKLPCAVSGSAAGIVETGAGIRENAGPLSDQPTALVIDDEVMTGRVTAEILNHLGLDTVYVDNLPLRS